MRLEGKVALITGGARGMGAAEAKLFSSEGAKVVIADVLEDEGRQTEAEINETGGDAIFVRLDVTQQSEWDAAVARAIQEFGKLDIVVNNAGIAMGNSIEDTSVEAWDRVMDINAKGVFFGTKAAIAQMKTQGTGGSIINISSVSGIIGQNSVNAVYNASKGAVRIFSKSAAIQHAAEGIRVNTIHPGPIETPMTAAGRANAERIGEYTVAENNPMGRYGKPEEVAYGALFLASDESSYVTGSEIVIDGGFLAQ
ncbi:MAG: glucose 1-dehydrogenase [Dehalococcoidia bacterium]|nr:glucose 1-dehydrogenase [Dehalococcoidia bacterium]